MVLRPFLFWGWLLLAPVLAQHATSTPDFDAATTETLKLKLGPGLKMDVWAAEPQLSNSVAFAFDGRGRVLLAQSDRWAISVFDITAHTNWLLEDMSFRTVADRAAFLQREFATNLNLLTKDSERIRRLEDRDRDGRADHHVDFATGFNSVTDGTAAGVLSAAGQVYFANIPNLWRFPDASPAPTQSLRPDPGNLIAHGFGVHIGVSGHDLHGLTRGPDGRIYFSFGDRGLCLTNREGVVINLPDTGGVLRCEPDGSRLELFCFGLRNPQELAFDDGGNLWTVDNDTAGADPCRVLHLVEGGDYGWRTSYQHMEGFGPWVQESLWKGGKDGILPPAGTVSQGPSGLAFYPGTGFGSQLQGRFLHCDFPGGVWSYSVKPRGASYEVEAPEKFLWGCWPTDVDFGPDGAAYVLDWVSGWGQTPRGRIYRITPTAALESTEIETVRQVKELLATGLGGQRDTALLRLLAHADRRIRLAAQWELAEREKPALEGLGNVALDGSNRLARLHAVWALGQILRADGPGRIPSNAERAVVALLVLLEDPDRRLAAESAVALADGGISEGWPALKRLLADPDPVVRRRTGEAVARMPLGVRPNPIAGIAKRHGKMLRDRLGKGWAVRLGDLGATQTQAMDPLALVRPLLESTGDDLFLQHTARRILLQATSLAVGPGTWEGMNRLVESRRFPNERLAFVEGAFLQQALKDESPAIRLAALWTCRRLAELAFIHPQVVGLPGFHEALLTAGTVLTNGLAGPDPRLVEEAGRAIHGVPIVAGLPALASFITKIDCPTGLHSRVIDACSRLGTQQHAQMLASFAVREDVPDAVRVLAVRTLAEWPAPPALDRVNGLWRPMVVSARDTNAAPPASAEGGAPSNPLLDRAAQAARNFGRAAAIPELPEDLGRSVAYAEGHAVKRNPAPARRAFLRVAGDLLNPLNLSESGVPVGTREVLALQIATVEAAAALGVKEASSPLYERFTQTNSVPALRRAILVALATLHAAQTPEAVQSALEGSDVTLRVAALPYLDRLGGVEAVPVLTRLLRVSDTPKGDELALAQAAVAALGRLPGAAASEALAGPWNALEQGTLPGALELDVESAAESRAASEPSWGERLAQRRTVQAGIDAERNRVWHFALNGGNAERGGRVFRENPTVQCLRCHKVGTEGGIVGPDLSKVGARLSRAELLQSIVDPNARIASGFETVVVTMKSGDTHAGTVKGETVDTVELDELDGDSGTTRRVVLPKAEITRRDRGPSAMPEGLAQQLGRFELRDLVEYLAGMK
jgi:quinoprotein glucose dehydrogenase